MRPVFRGERPPAAFQAYRDAIVPLRDGLGAYCSYCERRFHTHLAVEHVQPKSRRKDLELEWTNFLLACCNCNSCKGDLEVVLDDYIWPDANNTLKAFSYAGNFIKNVLNADHPAHHKADALLKLVGLDKYPGHPDKSRRPEDSDLRWKDRLDTLTRALHHKRLLAGTDTAAMREVIVMSALGWGGFAIWFEVFQDDFDMCTRLIRAFPGTAADCFDNHNPVCKPGAIL